MIQTNRSSLLINLGLCLVFGQMVVAQVLRPKPIQTALYLGNPENFNTTYEDCIWKRLDEAKEKCDDEDVAIVMYTSGEHIYKTLVRIRRFIWNLCCKRGGNVKNTTLFLVVRP